MDPLNVLAKFEICGVGVFVQKYGGKAEIQCGVLRREQWVFGLYDTATKLGQWDI